MTTQRTRPLGARHVFFAAFAFATLFVFYVYEAPFLDPQSPAWQHVAKVKWWLLPHATAGTVALLLAPFQFSSRLRARSPRLHRVLGRLYVAGVAVATPSAVPIALTQGPPSLVMVAAVQSSAWVLTTALAVHCARAGNIAQHREWMIRSYPFAMVFVVARLLLAIPASAGLGEVGLVSVVWGCNAAACLVPTFVINWRALSPRQRARRATVY
ncbi:MAG TPA: DUF2306 domain-containing protein [Pyrinomonadaceae bacterium]|jgi:uncharacterized membrane protein